MAKYKFTKTIKLTEGVVLGDDGKVETQDPLGVLSSFRVNVLDLTSEPKSGTGVKIGKKHKTVDEMFPTPEGLEGAVSLPPPPEVLARLRAVPFTKKIKPEPVVKKPKVAQSSVKKGTAPKPFVNTTSAVTKPGLKTSVLPKGRPPVMLDNPYNPYHGTQRRLPPVEKYAVGGMFGVFAPKPVGRSAAMSFQKDRS